ncbi:hypothetical protein PV325_001923 [Microctonus aethiopoides]|nr:hypothetical protein PV325_001923 [Microctonus aethiopoides]
MFLLALSQSLGEDYYKLLGLEKNADQKEIRQAFKKLAVTHHPDKNNDDPEAHDKFIKYTTAYEVLKDPELRKKYDLYGEEGLNDANKRHNYHSYSYYQNNFGIYDDDPQVVTLNTNDYDDNVINSEKIWIINFYSPMCSHCRHLAPIWRRVAKDLEGVVRIGAVNCEDDWNLCRRLGIQSYPTLLYYPKNSHHGVRYTQEKSYDTIVDFIFERLDVNIEQISKSKWNQLINGNLIDNKSILIFTCGKNRQCFTADERLKIAAIFENIIDTGIIDCDKINCGEILSSTTGAVFLSSEENDLWTPVIFNDIDDVEILVHEILQQLPEPQELTANDFKEIEERLGLEDSNDNGWLLCFYIGHATELDLQLKRLPSIIHDVNLGKLNCAKYSNLCGDLNINRYPMWGVLKSGGAFELSHGKSTINDVAKFAENAIKAENVWALSGDKILSILKRQRGNEVWFIDWYAPWCPPCIQFLPELRKASLEFDKSIIHFGTIDCTIHSSICRQYNIKSYPTAMLINGTVTSQFTMQKTASNVVEFINEAMNPTVFRLNADNYYQTLGRKKSKILWAVDYFAPWCGPCQQLTPHWTAVAKIMKILPNIKIASVDCQSDVNLCRSQGVNSYPNIRLYPMGSEGLNKAVIYEGARDSTSLMTWIGQYLPVKVKELNGETLGKKVLNSKKEIWLIDYYAPWCGHCQTLEPHFIIGAQLLEGIVRFGRLNCDNFRSECVNAGVRGYPTLILYLPKGKNGNSKRKDLHISATTAEQIKNEVFNVVNVNNKYRDEL